jgi:hypothetical protein
MEVHAHTHTARKKCLPDLHQNGSVGLGTGRNPLFLRGSHFVPCYVLQFK